MPEIVEIEIRHPGEPEIAVIEVGFRGPAGRNGVGGADISATEGNALQVLPDGLFVAPGGTAELPTGQPGQLIGYGSDGKPLAVDAPDDPPPGEPGADGKSAYQLALENGFIGTLEEWLESLRGADGEPGRDGQDGADGKDGIGIKGDAGEPGQDGNSIYAGSGSPSASLGKSGDIYINADSGDIYLNA